MRWCSGTARSWRAEDGGRSAEAAAGALALAASRRVRALARRGLAAAQRPARSRSHVRAAERRSRRESRAHHRARPRRREKSIWRSCGGRSRASWCASTLEFPAWRAVPFVPDHARSSSTTKSRWACASARRNGRTRSTSGSPAPSRVRGFSPASACRCSTRTARSSRTSARPSVCASRWRAQAHSPRCRTNRMTGGRIQHAGDPTMKTQAAVAYAAGKPLEVVDGRPRWSAGRRSAGRDQGHRHLPHGRVHALGRRPGRPVPGDLRPRRRGHRRRRRPRRHHAEEGRSRHSALHAGMPPVQILPVAQDQSVHGDPRHAGQGRDARWHQPLLDRQGQGASLHGLLHVLQLHRAAGDRAGEDPRGRAVRQGLLHRLRRHHRHRRGHQHRQGRAGRERRGVRPRRHRPERDPGRDGWPARTRSSASTSTRAARRWPRNSA